MQPILTASLLALALAAPAYAQSSAPAPAPGAATGDATVPPAATGQAPASNAGAAGSAATTSGVSGATGMASPARMEDLRDGLHLRNSVIGQSVYDDANARIGEIDELVLTGGAADAPGGMVSAPSGSSVAPSAGSYQLYAIVGVGGFLGIGERKVVTPLSGLRRVDGRFVMSGITKQSLSEWPEYRDIGVSAAGSVGTGASVPPGVATSGAPAAGSNPHAGTTSPAGAPPTPAPPAGSSAKP